MPDNLYSDIIDMPHHVSKDRPHLSMHQRAAQFSPFAALVGYEEVIEETRRQTDLKRELDETEKAELDRKLSVIAAHLTEKPIVVIEYFVPVMVLSNIKSEFVKFIVFMRVLPSSKGGS